MATTSRSTANVEHADARGSLKTANLSQLISQELDFLEESFREAKRRVDRLIAQINETRNKFDMLQRREDIETELQELKQTVSKLRSKIPFDLITPEDQPNPNLNRRPRSNPNRRQQPIKPLDEVANFDDDDDDHPTSDDLKWSLNSLDYYSNYCLPCFFVFPEKAIIKRSLMVYWANPDGLSPIQLEYKITKAIHDLVSKGFIKPVLKSCSRAVSGYWMHPFVRSTLKGCFNMPWVRDGRYLVNSIDEEDIIYSGSAKFSTMKHLVFLHLGKWQRSFTHHIEMEDPGLYFKNVKSMDDLRFISFRGTSMMKELPKIVTKLKNLEVLDLKACPDLEVIPSNIGNLRLRHLDMSECYFLYHMPMSISRLFYLRVLIGFLVGETTNKKSCTLQDLVSMKYLVKLNIYTSMKGFPNEDQLTALQELEALRNLTISWGGCSQLSEECESSVPAKPTAAHQRVFTHGPDPVVVKKFSFRLEKLDLQCVPKTLNWLRPSNFRSLKKLYIRGGKFNDLGHALEDKKNKRLVAAKEDRWSVEILRLKHLSKLKMDWNELVYFFPMLVSVEKVHCPNLTSFPCDGSGLWSFSKEPPTSRFTTT